MNLGLSFASWEDVKKFASAVAFGWNQQHKPDGTHKDITADSITTTDLTVSDDLAVTDDVTIGGNLVVTGNLDVSGPGTYDFAGGLVLAGTLEVSGQVSVDDLAVTGATSTATLTVTDTGASALDVGGGLNIGTGNVALVGTDGKINGPLSSTIIDDLSGANLTGLNATQLTSGTVPDARYSAWVAVAHNGANFTASSGTWTVASADQVTYSYARRGNAVTLAVVIQNSSVSATPASLIVAIPFTAALTQYFPIYVFDNGTQTPGYAFVSATGTTVTCRRTDAANFGTSTDNTWIAFTVSIEVS